MFLKRNISTWLWYAAFMAASLLVLNYALPYFLINPNGVMADIDGDAAKNYFTVIFHAMHGSGVWTMGMNYPYGEHTSFVDGQPLISVPLSYLRQWVPMSATGVLGVMHLLIFFSYWLGVVYVYKILRHYTLPRLLSLLFALLIICMSPQVTRSYAHFGLSYACIVPMLFYWSVKYYHTLRGRYAFWVFILGCAGSLLHPYWAALFLIWCGAYAVATLFRVLPRKHKLKAACSMLLAGLGVVAFFKIFLALTDQVTDRTTMPGSFSDYIVRVRDVVTSPISPVWKWLQQMQLVTRLSDRGEGFDYLGIAAICLLLVALVSMALKKRVKHPTGAAAPSRFWLFIAFATLAFAAGIPFIWGLENLLDVVPGMRQFRSLGRFGWIGYYIITTYAAVYWWRLYTRANAERNSIALSVALCLPLLLWIYEAAGAISFYRAFTAKMPEKKQVFFGEAGNGKWGDVLKPKGYKSTDFQTVVMVPYIHLGTDKIFLETRHTLWTIGLSFSASIELGLPSMNMYSSRSSWSRAFSQAKIMGGPYTEKTGLKLLPSSKPVLMLVSAEDSLTLDEKYVLQAASYIGTTRGCHLYAFYPRRLLQLDSVRQAHALALAATTQAQDSCHGCDGRSWFVKHFDEHAARTKVWGNGSQELKADTIELASLTIFPAADSLYEFSAWVLANTTDTRTPKGIIYSVDSLGNELQQFPFTAAEAKDFNGLWFRIGIYMPIDRRTQTLKCVMHQAHTALRIDELLLRPASTTIISQMPQSRNIMVNNHLVQKR